MRPQVWISNLFCIEAQPFNDPWLAAKPTTQAVVYNTGCGSTKLYSQSALRYNNKHRACHGDSDAFDTPSHFRTRQVPISLPRFEWKFEPTSRPSRTHTPPNAATASIHPQPSTRTHRRIIWREPRVASWASFLCKRVWKRRRPSARSLRRPPAAMEFSVKCSGRTAAVAHAAL